MAYGIILTVIVVVVGVVVFCGFNSEKERVDSVVQSRIKNMTVKEKQEEVQVAQHTTSNFYDNSQQNNAKSMTFEQHIKVAQERHDKEQEELEYQRNKRERERKEAQKRSNKQAELTRRERQQSDSSIVHDTSYVHQVSAPSYEPSCSPSSSYSSDSSSSSYDSGSNSSSDSGSSFSGGCD